MPRRQECDHVGSLPRVFQAGEGHQRAGNNLARTGQIAVQRRRIPSQTGASVRLGVMEPGHLSGVPSDHAEQARPDDVSLRLHRMADAAIGFEHLLTDGGILRARWPDEASWCAQHGNQGQWTWSQQRFPILNGPQGYAEGWTSGDPV